MQNPLIHADLIQNIRQILEKSRQYVHQTVNSTMVQTYWHIGRLIVEDEQQGQARAEYGKQQLAHLSEVLTQEYGKGFDITNLRNMRKFYRTYPIQETLSLELGWSHYCRLIRLENPTARAWYAKEAIENHWSVRALDRQIAKLYYERLLSSQDKTPVIAESEQQTKALQTQPKDFLRDPYILDFLNLPHETLMESDLEKALITNLQVLKLSHQDVGQMDTYVRIYDQHKKDPSDNPTIGLILCSEKSEAVAKYSVLTNSTQLFASKYLPYLPTEEELIKQLEYQRAQIEDIVGNND